MLAAQVTAQAGDPSEHDGQRWGLERGRRVVDGDVDGLPFGGVQHGVTEQLGGGPPQHGQILNPPGDDQAQGQGGFQALQGAELQGFHPAAGFQDSEKNLDIPLRIPLYD